MSQITKNYNYNAFTKVLFIKGVKNAMKKGLFRQLVNQAFRRKLF